MIAVIMCRVCWQGPATVIGRRPPPSPFYQLTLCTVKPTFSYLPARQSVSYFAVCCITGFLLLLQLDGAQYLDLRVLLHLPLILLWQCPRKTTDCWIPPPPLPQPSFKSCDTAPYRLSAAAHCIYLQLLSPSGVYL
jgi:hypothetical protein